MVPFFGPLCTYIQQHRGEMSGEMSYTPCEKATRLVSDVNN